VLRQPSSLPHSRSHLQRTHTNMHTHTHTLTPLPGISVGLMMVGDWGWGTTHRPPFRKDIRRSRHTATGAPARMPADQYGYRRAPGSHPNRRVAASSRPALSAVSPAAAVVTTMTSQSSQQLCANPAAILTTWTLTPSVGSDPHPRKLTVP
jgi:hypothetical protein